MINALLLMVALVASPASDLHASIAEALLAEGIDLASRNLRVVLTEDDAGDRLTLVDASSGSEVRGQKIRRLPDDPEARLALLTVIAGDLVLGLDIAAPKEVVASEPATDPSAEVPSPPATDTLAIHVQREGLSEREHALLLRVLTRTLQSVPGVTLAQAGSAPVDQTCPTVSSSCLSNLRASLGSPRVLVAQVLRVEDRDTLTLKLFDLERVEVLAATMKVATQEAGVLDQVAPAVAEVFPTVQPTWEVPADVTARWEPEPVSPWVFWSAAGATATVGATSVVLGLRAARLSDDAQSYYDRGRSATISGQHLARLNEDAKAAATLANVTYVTAGALAVTTLVLGLLTDFTGDVALDATFGADGANVAVVGAF